MNRSVYLIPVIVCYLFTGCTPKIDIPEPSPGTADFSKTVAIGGNYMAGYQDGALFQKGQRLSIPSLLAEQFELIGGGAFNQALMPDNSGLGLNSKTWESWFITPSHLGFKTDCKGVSALSPLKNIILESAATPYLSGVSGNNIQNLSVPFAATADYFNPAFGTSFSSTNRNPYYNRIASNPGTSTIFTDAKAQNATFVTAWLGMEDIFNYASTGGTGSPIPSPASFSAYLDTLLGGLTANGSKGVIATIPDFRTFPYYTLVAWDNADLRQTQADSLNDIYVPAGLTHIHFVMGRNGFVIEDPAANGGVRQLHKGEYITLSVPLDSMKCEKYGLVYKTISDRYSLDSTEVFTIDQAIVAYNAIIAQKSAQYGLALADMYSYFNSVKTGIKWDGVDFNATFVSGGFFSLDGYHPNQKGYALIANEFIKSINIKYNAIIPTINCVECNGVLFP
ncbi:MAG: SGNH/GDSL hydrolase family protein [Bacteroidota bacterium]